MKIKPEHLEHIRNAIAPLASKIANHREALKTDPRVKDLEKRLRWDLTYAAGLTRFFCDTIYPYANDDHIDTALRSIVRELETQPEKAGQ